MPNCVECGESDMTVSLFPFVKQGRQMYVCFSCLTAHRGMLLNVCPACPTAVRA